MAQKLTANKAPTIEIVAPSAYNLRGCKACSLDSDPTNKSKWIYLPVIYDGTYEDVPIGYSEEFLWEFHGCDFSVNRSNCQAYYVPNSSLAISCFLLEKLHDQCLFGARNALDE